jgi:uncharacterized protein DUF955
VPLVVVNGRQPLVRQRFTLAHELGHHRMGHGYVVDDPAAIAGRARSRAEVAANAFAAELLLPRAAVASGASGTCAARSRSSTSCCSAMSTASALRRRATRWRARAWCATRRAKRALDAEIADGMHVRLVRWLGLEPLADGLADAAAALPRIPSALRGTALGDHLAGAIDEHELAQRVGAARGAVIAMLRALGLDRLVPG